MAVSPKKTDINYLQEIEKIIILDKVNKFRNE